MLDISHEEALAHFGVKGMKWGVRNARDSAGPKKLSRKEVRAEKKAFYQNKGDRLVKTALKDPESLIKLSTPAGTMVVTGKEFVNYLSNGGYMKVKTTDLWATKDKKSGQYVMNAPEKFVRSDKKK